MTRLKKILLGILVCALVLCSVVAIAACDENPEQKPEPKPEEKPEHVHEWADDYTIDTAATCTEAGSKSIHCKGCDETKDVTAIPANGHAWAEDYTIDLAPTCTAEGSKSKHCTVDGCDGKDSVTAIPANGHAWDEDFTIDSAASCTVDGSKSIHCNNCSETKEVTVIPATGHIWAEDYTIDLEPTCTEEGSKSLHCKVDGCDGRDSVSIPANGHDWAEDYTIDLEPTCTEEGSKSIHCNNCSENKGVTVIPATGHKWAEEYTIDLEPTCTEEGSKSKHCTVDGCDGKDSVSIPANGHDWAEDYTIDLEPTCTEEGSKSIHCNNCSETKEVTVIPATGHSATAYPETESTCAVKGHDAYWQCDACGKYFSDEACETSIDEPVEYALANHTYDSWDSPQQQKASTCTEDGYLHHNLCIVCHTKFDINDTALANPISDEDWAANYVLPAKHTSVTKRAVKDPTCSATGYSTEHYYCSKCKTYALDADFTQIITADEAQALQIAALGHDYSDEWTIDVEATCAKAGSQSHHCSRCTSKTGTTAIPTLPHTWDESEYIVDLEPTCQAVGSKSYHCSVCGAVNSESAVEVPISPDSHAWSHRSFILTPATCVSEGSQAKFCLLCGAQQEPTVIPINPNAHNYSVWWTVESEPTCTDAGSKYHQCLNESCDAHGSVTEIPMLGHSYEWQVDGTSATAICVNGCNDTKSYTLPDEASGITFNNIVEAETASSHLDMYLGVNLINVTSTSGRISFLLDFVAEKSGKYMFAFEYPLSAAEAGANAGATIKKGTVVVSDQALITKTEDGKRIVGVAINVLKGETLTIQYNISASTISYVIMTASLQEEIDKSLEYGENTISVTVEGDSEGVDSYTFTPTVSKKYSMIVPEGLSVAKNNQNFISSGTYAEFDGTANTAITFSFAHGSIGEYNIVIGEALPQTLGLGANLTGFTILGEGDVSNGNSMSSITIGEDVSAGIYKLTINVRLLQASLLLGLNYDGTPDDFKGESWTDGDADVYLTAFNAMVIDKSQNITATASYTKLEITLELISGDVICFLTNKNTNITGVSFSLEKVA